MTKPNTPRDAGEAQEAPGGSLTIMGRRLALDGERSVFLAPFEGSWVVEFVNAANEDQPRTRFRLNDDAIRGLIRCYQAQDGELPLSPRAIGPEMIWRALLRMEARKSPWRFTFKRGRWRRA